MNIEQNVLRKDLKDFLYKAFLKESKNQLVSVYKQLVDMNIPACKWGGCWVGLDENITYRDIEDLVECEDV